MNLTDKKVRVGLYLLGDELDPSKISDQLGVVPTETRRKGELRKSGETGREYINKTGLWCLVIEKNHAEVVDVLASLLAVFQNCEKSLEALDGVQDAYYDVFVAGLSDDEGEGTCELSIESVQLAALARFKLPIRFTVNIGRD